MPVNPSPSPTRERSRSVLPTLTWAVLVVSVAANFVASAAGVDLTVHLVLGGVTAAAVAVLTVLHLRTKR